MGPMIPQKAYPNSIIKEVVMSVKRVKNKPKKVENVKISSNLAQTDDLQI